MKNTATMTKPPPPQGSKTNEWTEVNSRRNEKQDSKEPDIPAAKLPDSSLVRTSIYRVKFPVMLNEHDASPRNPYRCIRHILAILAKNCDHLHVLPKDAHDSTNEPVCLWSAFPNTKTAASAYLFNVATPGQNFGARAGAVDFRAEFRVSCSSSIKWMKNNKDIMAEMDRHKYWISGRADGPTVPMKTLFWLVKPDPDNCSTANLRSLLEKQLPDEAFLHLEKHRLQVKPSPSNSIVFVTHALKVLAPATTAWTTKSALEEYLHDTDENEKPIPLRGVKTVNMNVSKMELSAMITVQNEYLNQSAAIQVMNVWRLDIPVKLTQPLIDKLATDNLEDAFDSTDVCEVLRNADCGKATMRELLYAVLESREDIPESPILDDYVRGGQWNIVCKKGDISYVTKFMEWFLSCMAEVLTMQTVAQLCGCNRPFDPNQHPRVEFAKQYEVPDTAKLKQTFGFDLDQFKKRYNLTDVTPPESTPPPDLTKPPKETFRPQHYAKMKIQSVDRPSWASTVYEESFNTKEPANNPYATNFKKSSYAAATAQTDPETSHESVSQQKKLPAANNPYARKESLVPGTQTPVAVTATQNTTISTLTPPTNSSDPESNHTPPPTKHKPAAVTPTSSVTQDTQSKLEALAKEMETMRKHKASLDDRLKTLESGQNSMSTTMNEMAANINVLMKHFTKPQNPEPAPSFNDFNAFKTEIKTIMKSHFDQFSSSAKEIGITVKPPIDLNEDELPLELLDDQEMTAIEEIEIEEDMDTEDHSSTTPAREVRKNSANSDHQPEQKRHKGDGPVSGSG